MADQNSWFSVGVSEERLSTDGAEKFIEHPGHGAQTSFIGAVRDLNMGRSVEGVSYDCFDPLTKTIFTTLVHKAREKWGQMKVYCWHYKGRLDVKGLSIIIAVSTPHRDEAFQACRFLIEEIKHQAPIWKKEHYVDGDSEWTEGCELCGEDHVHKGHQHTHDH
ncbi:molybdenum cofactor biosynthesis protein MoaE [Temperatibacter marinus]|uniref:Molybdopterin synthase catalytic subunit n=1 Tax=Temperatibacter marinus TaxID=1456591 RepID=A0AA52HAF5_9PROT|nr:molybdenum cofactor biosynthesis protein MoaE [Temperatibacter marinus]WND02690.1 molybdenum cofactor biosynthesis protein MoaE [Temperatibacter marinus]